MECPRVQAWVPGYAGTRGASLTLVTVIPAKAGMTELFWLRVTKCRWGTSPGPGFRRDDDASVETMPHASDSHAAPCFLQSPVEGKRKRGVSPASPSIPRATP